MRLSSIALRIALGLGLITALAALAQQRPAAQVSTKPAAAVPAVADAAAHQAMIDQYCVMCHSDALKTAGVVLEGTHIDHVGDNTALWEKVLRKFGTGQMPPPGLPRPDAETSAKFTSWLESSLNANAVTHPNPGAPAIHRLNRLEYGNTIRDLLGLEVDVNTMLPGDDSGYGFDNIADVLSVSPVLLEKYMSAARKISRVAVGAMDIPAEESEFIVPFGTPTTTRVSEDLPLGSRGGYAVHYNFPVDAEYTIRVTMANGGDRGTKIDTRIPVKAGPQVIGVSFGNESPMPENTGGAGRGGAAGTGAGVGGGPQKLDLRMDDVRVKLLDAPAGSRAVFSMSVIGPYNPTGPGVTPSRKKLFVCTPTAPAQDEACARQILTNLAHHAYRRPVTNADVSPLMGFYQRGRQSAGTGPYSFDKGIEAALRAVLVSPDFLFREEQDPAGAKPGSVYKLTDYELASRLSYFLWSSMPDDELTDLAQKGRLHDTSVVDQQVHRMLADSKANSLVKNFAGQWLFLRNVESDKKDKDAFPDYDQNLRDAFKTETEMLFSSVLQSDGSLLDLLRANYTFVNERLAKHYGIPDVYGPAFRKVILTDPNRFGLLGQGSLLTVTSLPNRTSVVQRGKWILENLLGAPPPPPPPGAADGFTAHGSGGHLTLRQAMEQHRADPNCAVCHTRMDPLGFALENYNGIGKWRVMDDTGAVIDAKSTLPDGAAIDGPAGLSKLLLTSRKVDFVNTFTTKLMTYALGRGVESYDQPVIRSITREAARDDYRMSTLILGVIHSAPFQMRRAAED
jgi:mono/diheme cytochrome c family protein